MNKGFFSHNNTYGDMNLISVTLASQPANKGRTRLSLYRDIRLELGEIGRFLGDLSSANVHNFRMWRVTNDEFELFYGDIVVCRMYADM